LKCAEHRYEKEGEWVANLTILMKGRYKFRIVNIRVYFTIHQCHMSMDKDRYGVYRLRARIELKGQEKGWI